MDDIPKCGAYTEMPPDPLAPMTAIPDPIPCTELVDAEGVLATRLSEIRAERAAVRTKRISLEEHFTPEELDALQLAFSRTDPDGAGARAPWPDQRPVGLSACSPSRVSRRGRARRRHQL